MPLVLADRVKETTTSTGTGTITLAGAVGGFQSFSVIGNGNTTYYTISSPGSSEWEIGIGTYTSSGTTLSRDTVLASSAGAPTKTNFSAGTKDVFVTYTAARSVNVDGITINAFGMGATQGDILYASSTDTFARLAKNATATRYLSNTGTNNNPAWSQIDLSNGVTGYLPFANLAQGSALSVLGVTGNATADNASIAAGTDHQVLRRSGTALAFGAVNLAQSAAITGTLALGNGGTGSTTASGARTNLDAQQTLVSGTNIKTVNGTSLLGSGDVSGTPTIQTTTLNSGTSWSKPTSGNYQWVQIEVWGGGGSGGKGSATYSGGGGGGGAYSSIVVPLSYLAASETYSIGGGGNAQTTASTAGNAGGTTTFNISNYPGGAYTHSAYGGGGGAGNNGTTGHGGGGGGGGGFSAGGTGSLADGGAGGELTGGVAQASSSTVPGTSTYGGGGGSRGFAALNTVAGGASYFGGGGGGAGGAAGGAAAYGGGGGGGGGTTTGAGAGGNSTFGGDGGAGAVSTNNGTAGSSPSGGGGGCRNGTSSGAGAGGQIKLTWW